MFNFAQQRLCSRYWHCDLTKQVQIKAIRKSFVGAAIKGAHATTLVFLRNVEVSFFYMWQTCAQCFFKFVKVRIAWLLKKYPSPIRNSMNRMAAPFVFPNIKRSLWMTNANQSPYIPTSICYRDVGLNALASIRCGAGCCNSIS